ncbi:MBOAT family protein [Bremerella sp.]|uniref:MBOAT family protein n=1 Tax=Bremerella sp. TaxID=2795602 RepID=UPI00391B0819
MNSPWVVMWSLAVAIYIGCKWLTWHFARQSDAGGKRVAEYLVLWPGMDSEAFLHGRSEVAVPTLSEWLFAAGKMALGIVLLYGVLPWLSAERELLVGWTGMVGLIFVLHFGLFHLLSCWWRAHGVDAKSLMDWPIVSTSLGEFWGRRWNRAFRDLTFRYLFRPLTKRFGATWGLLAGFLMSGLVHDAVISIPAGGGYGGPTLFFVLQGIGMMVERSTPGRRVGLGSGAVGWLFTAACLVLPVAMLFHPPFVRNVMVPFLHVIGAA